MQFSAFSGGELSEDEVSDLPSCAFAGRPTSSTATISHHYLSNLHHNSGNKNKTFPAAQPHCIHYLHSR